MKKEDLKQFDLVQGAWRIVRHGHKTILNTVKADVATYRKVKASREMISAYLRTAPVKKLQIGAGTQMLDGWLNVDSYPLPGAAFMDAAKPFPFPDGSFDFVYSENFFEHLPIEDGMKMLRESKRILKPGGVIRTSTPDLRLFLRFYTEEERYSHLVGQYFDLFKDYMPAADIRRAVFVINNEFRNWGHQFIYDEETLAEYLRRAGFTRVKRVEMGQSEHPDLVNLETRAANPEHSELNNFSMMVLEATA